MYGRKIFFIYSLNATLTLTYVHDRNHFFKLTQVPQRTNSDNLARETSEQTTKK